MKKLLLFILILPLLANAQEGYPIDSVTNQITYKETISIAGQKNVLYRKAKEWFVNSFNSGKDVIQLDDASTGKLIGKSFFIVNTLERDASGDLVHYDNSVWFTITINVKDGKYRYIISDFIVEYHYKQPGIPLETLLVQLSSEAVGTGSKLDFQLTPKKRIKDLIASLKKAMTANDDF